MSVPRLFLTLLATGSMLGSGQASAQGGGVVPLESPDSVYRHAEAVCTSSDGSQSAGILLQNAVTGRAVYWDESGAAEELGTIGGAAGNSVARAISDEGTVVGSSIAPDGNDHAFRWTPAGGMQDLGTIGGLSGDSFAFDVTPDGSVVVGLSAGRAFRWTSAGMISLGDRPASARAVSGDGTVVVGDFTTADPFSATKHAFRWTPSGGMQDLGALGANHLRSFATDVSADGKVIVGQSQTGPAGSPDRAFRWTVETGMQPLGTIAGNGSSEAFAVSADGRVIIGKSGVQACLWYDDGPHVLNELLDEFGIDRTDWGSLTVRDCSSDGTVLVGSGYHLGDGAHGERTCGFRVALPVRKPTATPLLPVVVECSGGQNLVTLTTTVDGPDEGPLTVTWSVDGIVRQTTADVARGTPSTFTHDYEDGAHEVVVIVRDRDAQFEQATTVTVSDTTDPIVIVGSGVTLSVDKGKLFATNVGLPAPVVSDACDANPSVTSDAPSQFPLGWTLVTWTVRDVAGNVATAHQSVLVVNKPPRANAGPDVSKLTTSGSVRVSLIGSRSSDPDLHPLKFAWSSGRVRLQGSNTPRPRGVFPVGRTTVTLTVTDAAGAKSVDRVVVKVKRKRARRPRAAQADAYAAASVERAIDFAASTKLDADAMSGIAYLQTAQAYGSLAGDDLGAEADSPTVDETLAYRALRRQQVAYSRLAVERFLRSSAASDSEAAFQASRDAWNSASCGWLDLME